MFIDEMHTIIGAGAAEGAIDASNILNQPGQGEIQPLVHYLDEYQKHVEKDAALRTLLPVMVENNR